MLGAMLAATFKQMARLVLAGWRRMLVATALMVLATAAVLLPMLASIGGAWSTAVEAQRAAQDAAIAASPDGVPVAPAIGDLLGTFGGVIMIAMLAGLLVSVVVLVGATMVVRAGAIPGESLAGSLRASFRLLPCTSSQAGVALAPPLLVIVAAWGAAQVHPLLALPVVLVAYVVMFACTPWTLLAIAGSSLGDRDLVPRESWRLFRAQPWPLLGVSFVGLMAVGAIGSVLVLPGGIMLLGPAPILAIGLGIIVAVQVSPPMVLAAALYEVAGGSFPDAASGPPRQVRRVVHDAGSSTAAPGRLLVAPLLAPAPVVERFEAVLDAATPWGVWLEATPGSADAELRIAWSAGTPAPRLLVADAAGAWSEPAQPTAVMPSVQVQLPSPRAYLHLETRGEPQQVVVEVVRAAMPQSHAS